MKADVALDADGGGKLNSGRRQRECHKTCSQLHLSGIWFKILKQMPIVLRRSMRWH